MREEGKKGKRSKGKEKKRNGEGDRKREKKTVLGRKERKME